MAINYPTCTWNITDPYLNYLVQRFNTTPENAKEIIDNTDCSKVSYDYISDRFVTSLIVVYCIILPCGFLGNLAIIFTVLSTRKLQLFSNTLLVGMCFSDLVLTLTLPWTLVRNISYDYTLGGVLCKVIPTLQGTVVFSVIFTLVAIAIERQRAIVYPLKRRFLRTNLRAMILLLGIWVFTLLFNIPQTVVLQSVPFEAKTVVISGSLEYTISGHRCEETWSDSQIQIYSIIIAVIGYLIPLLLLFNLYGTIAKVLWNRRVALSNISGGSVRRHYEQRRKRVILLISLVLAFAILWGPYFIIQCTLYYTSPTYNPSVIPYLQLVGHFNVAVNPILYAVFHENIRSEFIHKIKRLFRCNKRSTRIHTEIVTQTS